MSCKIWVKKFLQCWAEALLKIARMTLTIKLDGNWSSFQLANSAPPLSVTDSALAPSARMIENAQVDTDCFDVVWQSSAIFVRIHFVVSVNGSTFLSCGCCGLWIGSILNNTVPPTPSQNVHPRPQQIFSKQTDTRCPGFILGSTANNSLSNVACVSFSFHSKSAAVDFYHRRNSDI